VEPMEATPTAPQPSTSAQVCNLNRVPLLAVYANSCVVPWFPGVILPPRAARPAAVCSPHLCTLWLCTHPPSHALPYSDAKVANRNGRDFEWEVAHAAVSRRPLICLYASVPPYHMTTYDTNVGDFVPRSRTGFLPPCQTLVLRSANFCVAVCLTASMCVPQVAPLPEAPQADVQRAPEQRRGPGRPPRTVLVRAVDTANGEETDGSTSGRSDPGARCSTLAQLLSDAGRKGGAPLRSLLPDVLGAGEEGFDDEGFEEGFEDDDEVKFDEEGFEEEGDFSDDEVKLGGDEVRNPIGLLGSSASASFGWAMKACIGPNRHCFSG
jgi:hypothetical protein